jgi:hypothetical protein
MEKVDINIRSLTPFSVSRTSASNKIRASDVGSVRRILNLIPSAGLTCPGGRAANTRPKLSGLPRDRVYALNSRRMYPTFIYRFIQAC